MLSLVYLLKTQSLITWDVKPLQNQNGMFHLSRKIVGLKNIVNIDWMETNFLSCIVSML